MTDKSLMDQDIQECPWTFYKELRDEAPVYMDPQLGCAIISRYDDVVQALRSPDIFSTKMAFPKFTSEAVKKLYDEKGHGEMIGVLVQDDPPRHTRFRSLVNLAFTADRVQKMEPYIEGITNSLIDGFIDKGEVDILKEFCMPLPLTVIADQIGVSRDDIWKLREWTNAGVAATVDLMASEDEQIALAEKIIEFQLYFADRIEERRANPQDDMITDLINAEIEGERPLDLPELLAVIQQLLVGGNETTTNGLGAGIMQLIKNPEQAEALRADPSLYTKLPEEVLRIESPVQGLFRMTMEDVEIGGTTLPKGTLCQVRFGSANHDDSRFECPEDFDIERKAVGKHLAFGSGIHLCIGMMLARREMTVGLRAINTRLKNLKLAVPEEELTHVPSVAMRGYTSLPVSFEKR